MSWYYTITSSNPGITKNQMKQNADEFVNYFNGYMSSAAMAGILGNMQHESFLNPGQQEIGKGGSGKYGYGLIQWTPGSTLQSWLSARGYSWYDGTGQLYRIKCEGERTDGASGYWLKTSNYSYTWAQFCQLTDPAEACKAYLAERERAGVAALTQRLQYTAEWYDYIVNAVDPPDPSPTPPIPDPRPQDIPFWYGGVRDLQRRGIISNGKL